MLCASAFQFTKTGMRLRMKDKRECTRTFWSETYQKVQNHRFCFRNTSHGLKLARRGKARVISVGCSAHDESESGGGGGGDNIRALETVLKLYTAIKNKRLNQISDVIGDECLCICNFTSSFQPFCGKEQVLAFFTSLMKHLGNNVEFIVQPTFQDGLNVGISWKLEWTKNHYVPLGKGFSFYTCHMYRGKMVIRNFDMFLEPILHIEPFRLKTVALLMNVVDEIWWLQALAMFKEKAKEIVKNLKIMFPLLLMAAIFFIVKYLY